MYLTRNVGRDNVLELANLAETLDMKDLSRTCANFIIQEEIATDELDGLAPSFLRKLYARSLNNQLIPETFRQILGNWTCKGVNFYRRVLTGNPIKTYGSFDIKF